MFGDIEDPVGLRYRRRANPETALETPSGPRAQSSNDVGIPSLLGEDGGDRPTLTDHTIRRRDIMRALTSEDPDVRALAITAANDLSRRFGDILTANHTVELSESGLFPPVGDQGIPEAVSIDYNRESTVDTQWVALFQSQDRRDQTTPLFKITNVFTAAEFKQYERGEEIEMRHVEASDENFEANIYAGGLHWNRLWSEWQTLWSENDGVAAMQAAWGKKQAARAYSVLTAGSPGTTSYQDFDGSGGTSQANDAATFNAAMTTILNDIYTNTTTQTGEQTEESIQNPRFFLLINQFDDTLWLRAVRALASRFDMPNDNNSEVEVRFPVQIIQTPHISLGSWWMVLPGRKNVFALFRDLTMFDKEDVQVAGVSEGAVGQGAYKIVRADSNQVQQMNTS